MIKKIKTLEPYNDNSFMLCWLYTSLNYYRTFLLNRNIDKRYIDAMSLLKTSINYLIKNKKIYELKNMCLDFQTFLKIIESFNCNYKNKKDFNDEFNLILEDIDNFLLYNNPIIFTIANDEIDKDLKIFFNNSRIIFNRSIYRSMSAKNFDFIEKTIIKHISNNEPIILCFDNSYKFNNNYYELPKKIQQKTIKNLYKNSLNCCVHMALIVGVELNNNQLESIIVQDNLGTKFDYGNYKVSCEYLKAFCHYVVFQGDNKC